MANIQILSANLNITDLPPEVMEKIFEYLTFQEHLQISAACKSWHNLVFRPQFCKRLFIHLRTTDDLVTKPHAREMFGRCRNVVISFNSIRINQVAVLKDYLEGASLESIKIISQRDIGKCIVETVLPAVGTLKTLILELNRCRGMSIEISHPTLKCLIANGAWDYVVNCANLTALETNLLEEKSVGGISDLRGQLRTLTLTGTWGACREFFSPLCIVQWDHLQELCLICPPPEEILERMLEQMPYLEKLSILTSFDGVFTGRSLGATKCLKEFTLATHRLNTVSLNEFLSHSTLISINLQSCIISCPEREMPLKSSSIKRMTYVKCVPGDQLPLFPNLENFDLQCSEAHLDSTLKQISEYYPELEHMSIGVKPGQIGQYEKTEVSVANPFLHLNKLEKLKSLSINRIDLSTIDWTMCIDSKLDWLRLDGCSISGVAAEHLVQSFKHLRTLYLDHCYLRQPRTDLFDLDESCTDGLRTRVPHCRVSYYDCHIEEMFERCGRSAAVI